MSDYYSEEKKRKAREEAFKFPTKTGKPKPSRGVGIGERIRKYFDPGKAMTAEERASTKEWLDDIKRRDIKKYDKLLEANRKKKEWSGLSIDEKVRIIRKRKEAQGKKETESSRKLIMEEGKKPDVIKKQGGLIYHSNKEAWKKAKVKGKTRSVYEHDLGWAWY